MIFPSSVYIFPELWRCSASFGIPNGGSWRSYRCEVLHRRGSVLQGPSNLRSATAAMQGHKSVHRHRSQHSQLEISTYSTLITVTQFTAYSLLGSSSFSVNWKARTTSHNTRVSSQFSIFRWKQPRLCCALPLLFKHIFLRPASRNMSCTRKWFGTCEPPHFYFNFSSVFCGMCAWCTVHDAPLLHLGKRGAAAGLRAERCWLQRINRIAM